MRAFLRPVLLAAVGVALAVGGVPSGAAAAGPMATDVGVVGVVGVPSTDEPVDTVNPFLPDDRGISECVSALPKPGCGSEERGGWHQQLVFLALVGGLSVIGWRIVVGARKNARAAAARMQAGADAPAPAASVEPIDLPPAGGPPPPATMEGRAGPPQAR